MKISVLNKKSAVYPKRLSTIRKPPEHLHILGSADELLAGPTLGIVGSRKVTSYGRAVTEELAAGSARAGVCIVSGLALGADSIAHSSAIKANGKTIAVLPSGLKDIYPASHRGLAKNILASSGALISEYDDYFRPRRESFIERNRIIAGLSDALLVTEAAEKSGSLHTANFALEMGKTVMAVPGNLNSPNSRGTNNLLKAGAVMITEVQDILDAMGISADDSLQMDIYGDNEQESLILNLLGSGITSGDELLQKSRLEVSLFQQTLSLLEIKGVISPLGNNHWRRK